MTMDERTKRRNVKISEKRWDKKRKVLYRALETFSWNEKGLWKLCTAHEKTWMGTEKKFSVLHKYQVRWNSQEWYRGWPVQWKIPASASETVRQIRIWVPQSNGAMWSDRILPAYKGAGSHPLPTGVLWSSWKICHRKGTGYSVRTDACEICVWWWLRVNQSQSVGLCTHRRCRHLQSNGNQHL